MIMYGETFKDSLYGAFQPADGDYDATFLIQLMEYFPTDKVDIGSGTYDQYLYDLLKTVVDNYEKGNYQVSFFYAHHIFMSYVYYCVENAFSLCPDRVRDVYYSLRSYNGRDDKPSIDRYKSVYEFSKIPEKDIFKIFHVIGMSDQSISDRASYINRRDQYAHAAGKGNISVEDLRGNIRDIIIQAEAIHDVFKPFLKQKYIDYLLCGCQMEYCDVMDTVYDFISTDNAFSLHDLDYLCHLGISGIRDENKQFRENYRYIKKVHCAFIEYCMENMGTEEPETYPDLRNEAFLFYKYKDNAEAYVENELGISAYRCGKEGGEFPVYECPECGEEQLAYNAEKNTFHCFACDADFKDGELGFCSRCGGLMKSDETGICPNCIENMMDE